MMNLVIQTAFLGDLILSVPSLRKIKELFPEDELAIVCRHGIGKFLVDDGIVDHIYEIKKSDSKSYRNALNKINKKSVRHLYCLHRSIRSMVLAARIRALKKIGFSSFLGFWVFDDLVDFVPSFPEVIRQYKILETSSAEIRKLIASQDWKSLNLKNPSNGFEPIPAEFSFSNNVSAPDIQKKIAVFPGSVWETKKWITSGYRELVKKLVAEGYSVSLMGAQSERELCLEVASELHEHVEVLAGQLSVNETIRAISNYALVICNDSAPAHMAAYKNVPVLGIFGPTLSSMGFRPWLNQSAVIEDETLSCRPCGKHGHRVCPLQHHNCMRNISAEKVFQQSLRLLKIT